ncbi:MAG: MerR family transcriptional regulator [Ruminococcus sp.]|nr:MerR family transcriptional regulator [Ruminococcus sp.]
MPKYTTGEVAKLCNVSVRTVQYYDSRNLLVPSELSEGGRRLYSEDDLKMMKIICFLREAGLPINSISALLKEENSENVISVVLNQQEQVLREEIEEREKQLSIIESIKKEMKDIKRFSVESIGDIAHIMKNKEKLKKMRTIMLVTAIPFAIFEYTSIALWILKGWWWLFAIIAVLAVVYSIWLSAYYYKSVAYICPECHEVFKPGFKEMIFAYHTPKMRKLTCPKCGHKSLCVEVYDDKKSKKEK